MKADTTILLAGCALVLLTTDTITSYAQSLPSSAQLETERIINNRQFEISSKKVFDTLFNDYSLEYVVSKKELNDKFVVDSLFSMSRYYLAEALKGNYDRIIVRVRTKGIFFKERLQVYRVNAMLEALKLQTYGKKL